jgi:flavin-dependent dehydrogenase
MYDVAVIGGGPAGTAAAITAVDHGARVLLLEKGSFPRHKVCGEFVSAESLALLASLLSGSGDLLEQAPRLHRARLFIENRMLESPVEPAAASIPRIDLDAALWYSAKYRGVDARERQSVSGVEGPGPFVIRTAAEEFMARSVIDASGRWSNLNRKKAANGQGGAGKWLGVKAHFQEGAPSDSVDLYFFEGGYCGVQPVAASQPQRVNACAMIRSDVGTSLADTFQRHPELKKRSQDWQQLSDLVTTSPLLFHTPEPCQEGILRAGDAAGFVDPFVGDGISLALRGGALAAKWLHSFLHGQNSLQQAGENYQHAYRRELMPVFNASAKIRRLLGFPAPIRAGLLYAFASFPALTRYMVRNTR